MSDLVAALKQFLIDFNMSEHDRWEIEVLIKKYEKKIVDEKLKERK